RVPGEGDAGRPRLVDPRRLCCRDRSPAARSRPDRLRMLTIGLATCEAVPALSADDQLLQQRLEAGGPSAPAVAVRGHRAAWRRFDRVMIRSCWDYHRRPDVFAAWLERMEAAGVPLWNPPALVRQNMHKSYLATLDRAGVDVVPGVLLEKASQVDLAALLAER